MKCIFLYANKHESFLQVDTMIFDGGGQAFQNSQNSKFTMSLQYPKKELRDENDFLHADKQSWFQHFGHQSFLQDDTIIIDGHDQAFSKCPKLQVCNISTISQERS